MVEWEIGAQQGIGKVDHGQGHLAQEKDLLMAKLKAVEVKMEEGEGLRQKLIEIVANCDKMKQLPPESKATVFMMKNLRQALSMDSELSLRMNRRRKVRKLIRY